MRRMQCLESFIAGICGIPEYRSRVQKLVQSALPENQRTLSAKSAGEGIIQSFTLQCYQTGTFCSLAFAHFFSMERSLPSVWNMVNLWIGNVP